MAPKVFWKFFRFQKSIVRFIYKTGAFHSNPFLCLLVYHKGKAKRKFLNRLIKKLKSGELSSKNLLICSKSKEYNCELGSIFVELIEFNTFWMLLEFNTFNIFFHFELMVVMYSFNFYFKNITIDKNLAEVINFKLLMEVKL